MIRFLAIAALFASSTASADPNENEARLGTMNECMMAQCFTNPSATNYTGQCVSTYHPLNLDGICLVIDDTLPDPNGDNEGDVIYCDSWQYTAEFCSVISE